MGGADAVAERPRGLTVLYAVLLALAAWFLAYTIVHAVETAANPLGPFVDWRTYENATTRLLRGESIYAPEQLAGPYRLTDMLLVGFAYPPASVPLFIPFFGYPFGLAAWITLNLGLLLTALWAMISRAWPARRVAVYAMTLVALALFAPFQDGMVAMNANVGLAGAVGWVSIGLSARASGVLAGTLGVIKVFVGALALATTGSKIRALVWAFGTGFVLAVVTLPLVGVHAWFDFMTAMSTSVADCRGLNMSVACRLEPWVGATVGTLIGVVIAAFAAVGLLFTRQPFRMCVLAAIVILAPANNLHFHYWTIVFVVVVAALARLSALRAAGTERQEAPLREDAPPSTA
jgi:hypothetical protein